MSMIRVAVIGGGASAALLLCHLAQEPGAKNLSIDVFDRTGRFARGVAYSTTDLSPLLNVRAANMSALVEEKEDFVRWFAENGHPYTGDDFAPRRIYGDYLEERMKAAAGLLKVRFIEEDMIDVSEYDLSVLASGNVRPLAPVVEACRIYHPDPFTAPYVTIPKNGRVIIFGTGLSAADAVSSLKRCGFTGSITLISRNGWLPRVHGVPVVYERWAGSVTVPPSRMMREIRTRAKDAPWQAVIDALRPDINRVWAAWSAAERSTFLRHGFTLWNIHRHRMAPQVAAGIESYAGLEIVRDRIERVTGNGDVVCKYATFKGADAIINCLGYRYDETGRVYDTTYKIGPARFGVELETTAIPEIRAQAQEIARALTQ